jgi:hypothetical protein
VCDSAAEKSGIGPPGPASRLHRRLDVVRIGADGA